MADDKKEGWITWLALTTAFLAVFAAITTMYMGKFSTRAILAQGEETDQWAYYQAKSIKGHTYEIQKQKIELELVARPISGQALARHKKVISDYEATINRYEKEKAEIKARAEQVAKDKLVYQSRSGSFSYSLIFLQIAIVLSSVAAITKKKPLWYVGLAISSGWTLYFINAFFLWF